MAAAVEIGIQTDKEFGLSRRLSSDVSDKSKLVLQVNNQKSQLDFLHAKLKEHILKMVSQQDLLQNYLTKTRQELENIRFESDNLKILLQAPLQAQGLEAGEGMVMNQSFHQGSPNSNNINVIQFIRQSEESSNAVALAQQIIGGGGLPHQQRDVQFQYEDESAPQEDMDTNEEAADKKKTPRRRGNQQLSHLGRIFENDEQKPEEQKKRGLGQQFGRDNVYGDTNKGRLPIIAKKTIRQPNKWARQTTNTSASGMEFPSNKRRQSLVPSFNVDKMNNLANSGRAVSRESGNHQRTMTPSINPQNTYRDSPKGMRNTNQAFHNSEKSTSNNSNNGSNSPSGNKSIKIKIGRLGNTKKNLLDGSPYIKKDTQASQGSLQGQSQTSRPNSRLRNNIELVKNKIRKNNVRNLDQTSSTPNISPSAALAEQYQLKLKNHQDLRMPPTQTPKKYPSPRMSNSHIADDELLPIPEKTKRMQTKRKKIQDKKEASQLKAKPTIKKVDSTLEVSNLE